MARKKGTGKPEDEPVLRDMFRAVRRKEMSLHAAAHAFAERVPGDSPEKWKRLYRKARERRAELEAEIAQEEEGEEPEDGLFALSEELAGETPHRKTARLKRLFRIAAENQEVRRRVVEELAREGVTLGPEFQELLGRVITQITLLEREMHDYNRRVRERKPHIYNRIRTE